MDRRTAVWRAFLAGWVIVLLWGVGASADPTTAPTVPPTTTSSTVAPAPVVPEVRSTIDVAAGGEGLDGLVPTLTVRSDGEAPTLFERYPAAAYTWDGDYGARDIVTEVAERYLADPALTILVGWGMVVTRVQAWVFNAPQLTASVVVTFVDALRRAVWLPWGMVVIAATGVYVGWQALQRRVLEAISHIGWTVLIGTLAILFMLIPASLITAANNGTNRIARLTMAAGSVAPTVEPPDGTVTVATFRGDAADGAIRRSQDLWWRLFVYSPWAAGEFGKIDPDPGSGAGERVLAIKSGDTGNLTAVEVEMIQRGQTAICPDGTTARGFAAVVCLRSGSFSQYRDDVLERLPGVGPWVNGKHPLDRFGIALLALVASALSGMVIVGVSLAIVWWLYEGTFRLLLLPVYALRGMTPGRGPALFSEYAQRTVATFVKRVVASLMLAVLLIGLTGVSSSVAHLGWAAMAIAQIVASFVFVFLWRQHRRETLPASRRGRVRRAVVDAATVGLAAGTGGASLWARAASVVGGVGARGRADRFARRGAPDRTVTEPERTVRVVTPRVAVGGVGSMPAVGPAPEARPMPSAEGEARRFPDRRVVDTTGERTG